MEVKITPKEEVDQNWGRADQPARPTVRPLNLSAVLDMGSVSYFPYQRRSYKVPLISSDDGLRILDLFLEAEQMGDVLDRNTIGRYHQIIKDLRKIMWRLVEPVGILPRLLWRLGLHRNIFDLMTEREVMEAANFFLQRRMKSSGPFRQMPSTTKPKK